jgi:hypothetical protein
MSEYNALLIAGLFLIIGGKQKLIGQPPQCIFRSGEQTSVRFRPNVRSGSRLCVRKGKPLSMSDNQIDFSAPATLRKWPSVKNERVSTFLGARPYLIIDGTLDECIGRFMSQPESQRHLYEIHTAPQSDLVSAILSADHVVELARLRDFLGK